VTGRFSRHPSATATDGTEVFRGLDKKKLKKNRSKNHKHYPLMSA